MISYDKLEHLLNILRRKGFFIVQKLFFGPEIGTSKIMKFPYYIFIFVISKTVSGYVSRCGFSGKHCLGIIFMFVAGVKEGLNIPAWCMHLMAFFLQNKPQPTI